MTINDEDDNDHADYDDEDDDDADLMMMMMMMQMMTMTMRMMMTIIAIASSSHWNVLAAGPESYLTSPRPAGGSHFSLSKPPPCRRHHRHYTWDGMGSYHCFAQLNNG